MLAGRFPSARCPRISESFREGESVATPHMRTSVGGPVLTSLARGLTSLAPGPAVAGDRADPLPEFFGWTSADPLNGPEPDACRPIVSVRNPAGLPVQETPARPHDDRGHRRRVEPRPHEPRRLVAGGPLGHLPGQWRPVRGRAPGLPHRTQEAAVQARYQRRQSEPVARASTSVRQFPVPASGTRGSPRRGRRGCARPARPPDTSSCLSRSPLPWRLALLTQINSSCRSFRKRGARTCPPPPGDR
jgi:hypothetical protein